jgi:hypothetical protein
MLGRSYPAAAHWPEFLELPAESGIDDALEAVRGLLADGEHLSESCLVVVSGRHVGTVARHDPVALTEESELVLIAPVAGG